MAEIKLIPGGVCAASGFQAAGIYCGIRKNPEKKDLALITSSVPASAAAVYTTNLVKRTLPTERPRRSSATAATQTLAMPTESKLPKP